MQSPMQWSSTHSHSHNHNHNNHHHHHHNHTSHSNYAATSSMTSASSRRRPDLHINTNGSSSVSHDSHSAAPIPPVPLVPETPPPRRPPPISSAKALGRPPPLPTTDIESFLDGLAPSDLSNKENDRPDRADAPLYNPRDSHDLSLPHRSTTRDSLVTDLLLSLDQLSLAQQPTPDLASFNLPLSPFGEEARALTFTSRPGYGYSYSSDLEAADDASRISSQASRRRHSNSSSGFQSSLGRINSMREQSSREYFHRLTAAPRQPLHSRGRQGSKSSSANSMDAGYAQVLGSQRWPAPLGNRAMSFDHGPDRMLPPRPKDETNGLATASRLPWNTEPTDSYFVPADAFDAAPNPSVPGGPRRLATAPSMPAMLPPRQSIPEPKSPGGGRKDLDRGRSLRSSRSATVGQRAGSRYSTITAREPVSPAAEPVPPIPAFDLDAAPAPYVGYEKTKDLFPLVAHTASTPVSQQPTRDRPSFFRRMFGGARSTPTTPLTTLSNEFSNVASPLVSSTSVDTRASETRQQPQKTLTTHASAGKDSSPQQPPSTGHTLQKKTSSFFRRRKHSSAAETTIPPPLATSFTIPTIPNVPFMSDLLSPRGEPSPRKSLRKAMDPFLQGILSPTAPAPAPQRTDDNYAAQPVEPPPTQSKTKSSHQSETGEVRRTARGFSPEYEPSPRAVIRKVSTSREPSRDRPLNLSQSQSRTASRSPSRAPVDAAGSFLADDSDSGHEGSPPLTSKPLPLRSGVSGLRPRDSISERSWSSSPSIAKAKSSPSFGNKNRDELVSPLPQSPSHPPRNQGSRPSLHPAPGYVAESPVETRARSISDSTNLGMPIERVRTVDRSGALTAGDSSTNKMSIAASVPSVTVESAEPTPNKTLARLETEMSSKSKSILCTTPPKSDMDESVVSVGEPTDDDRLKAKKIFEGNEDFIEKEKAAAWMGEEGTVRQRTLRAYMHLYDLTNNSIVTSLRQLCGRLVLRAETQQVDRILVAFSRRWCECNPNHGFKAEDVIHTICYSIMLLNTDLHLADIDQKMTKSQFVKNTMTTIRHTLQDSAPSAFERPSILPGKDRPSQEVADRPVSFRNSFMAKQRTDVLGGFAGEPCSADVCSPLVKAPFDGPLKAWEGKVEQVLKDIYNSIRDERLPLYGAEQASTPVSVGGGLLGLGMLKRTPSVLSKAPSEGMVSAPRGRIPETGGGRGAGVSSRWTSKSRSRPRVFMGGSGNNVTGQGHASTRTSFDDGGSMWTPTESAGASATWSRASLGRTHTSMSMDSFASSAFPRPGDPYFYYGHHQQSIGFANALGQAMVREEEQQLEAADSLSSQMGTTRDNIDKQSIAGTQARSILPTPVQQQLLEDESLELEGPPWVKEGIVTHKHHLDGIDKKAKDRHWSEVFAVIQKGQLSLFSFSPNKSVRSRGNNRLRVPTAKPGSGAVVVGGGNWQDQATSLGTFSLRAALASELPPPGYSRARPHVWALSLPSGAVHLFQVGTPEIAAEFVGTSNYWAARLSSAPLAGGISNVEYGWGDEIVNNPLVTAINENSPVSLNRRRNSGASSGPGPNSPGYAASTYTGGASPPSARSHMHSSSVTNAATISSGMVPGSAVQSLASNRSASIELGMSHPCSRGSGVLRHGPFHAAAAQGKQQALPGERVHIADWAPPATGGGLGSSGGGGGGSGKKPCVGAGMMVMGNVAAERDQLETLSGRVSLLEEEFRAHSALRAPMQLAFLPRGPNAARATQNWERKSEYLLRETVRFRTYVESLRAAETRKREVYLERDLARRAAQGDEVSLGGEGE